MPHESWRDAVAEIARRTSTVTPRQEELARLANVELPADLPHLVAGARLQAIYAQELALPVPGECIEFQLELIAALATENGRVSPEPDDRREAEAWIHFLRLETRRRALESLRVDAGDIVVVNGSEGTQRAEVSSIGGNGRIHFKGGAGAGAWPDIVTVESKKGDDSASAKDGRRNAANQAALRSRATQWSDAKHQELEEFTVKTSLTAGDVDDLEAVIDAARDEKPIQKFIEAYPQVLTSLLGGSIRYCVSHPSLGDYIPDFLVCDVDSIGIRWVLVEIETPNSEVTIQRDNVLEQHARKGVSQVDEWREWLTSNVDYARRPRGNGGLGLVDIRPQSDGLVIVGRRARLRENSHIVRAPIRERRILVHTYDWLLERLRGILSFSGPAGTNPDLLMRNSAES